jgi:hypothetical protein
MINANADAFICVGKEYVKYQDKFKKFVNSIKFYEDSIPSLKFGEQSDTRIDLEYLGESYSIRLRCIVNSDGKIESKLFSLSKISTDNEDKYTLKIPPLSMDISGLVHLPGDNNKRGLLISEYEERDKIFFLLLGGKPDFATNYQSI